MNTAPDVLSTALQMLTALGIVLGGLLVIFYLVKRFLKKDISGSKEQFIRVIANQYIGIKKNIALVEVPGAVLVVGISNENISLLTKIDDQTILDGIRQEKPQTTHSFTEHLQRLTSKIKTAKQSD